MSNKKNQGTGKRYDPAFRQEVLQMVESGRSVQDMAKALGISAGVIYQWRISAKAAQALNREPWPKRRHDAAFRAEILQMVESGRTVREVAESLGVSKYTIYYWRSRAKAEKANMQHPDSPDAFETTTLP